MKFVIEVEDFYLDEESQLAPALTEHIKNTVVHKISESIKDRVEKQITMEVKARVEESMYRLIQSYVSDTVATGKMQHPKNRSEQILLSEYIQYIFENNSGWSSPEETIKKYAKTFGDQMKQRYDLLYASQIVTTLKENGLLNADAAKMLLDKK